VIACAVTQRTREIGIRTALGAQPGQLERMFVREGVVLAAVGVVCGLASAVRVTWLMSSLLLGIRPLDPLNYVIVSVVLITAAGIASSFRRTGRLRLTPWTRYLQTCPRRIPPGGLRRTFTYRTESKGRRMEPARGIEPPTYGLRNRCSTN
jgi:hypothetical protein